MLDASLDCVIAISRDGRVIEWNRAAERTFGYPREAAIGRGLDELIIPPVDRALHRDAVARSAANGGGPMLGRRIELQATRANGEEFPVELTVTRATGPDPIFVGYVRDITERARATRRRAAMMTMGRDVLTAASLENVASQIADLIFVELNVRGCAIWSRLDDAGPFERLAAVGESNGAGSTVPACLIGSEGVEDGLTVHTISIGEETVGGVALHGWPGPHLDEDVTFLDALGQVLTGAFAARRSARHLEAAEHRYRSLVERLPVVSYLAEYGPAGNWLYVSPQVEQLLGFPKEQWLEDPGLWWRQVHPEDRDRVEAEEQRCARTLEPLSNEYRMVARDGTVVWIRDEGAFGKPVNGGAVQVEGVMIDITERRLAVEELRHRAEHDELTGLANRRRFVDELKQRRSASGAAGALAIVDVDDLKYVNDALGHAAGDALIRGVATALLGALHPGEFLARFGGDEFTILLETSNEAALQGRLADLLRAVRTRQSGVAARASAGAVPFEGTSRSTDEDLIAAADIALHEAKERGGDRYSIFAGSDRERLAWVGQVRAAIANDRLCLYSQPIISVDSGRHAGGELLVRMLGEDGAVLAPAAFLPTAERFGLIREIDSWVVERAIEIAAAGRSVTVNLSARSISDPALTTQVARALERTGADPDRIVFEITETAAASASEELRDFGERVEHLGCALAIDDFGTGFGSLTYLKHLPVRYLKIDMEFVQGLCGSKADRAIVESIVTIAKSLDMETIAEGVEDRVTMEGLRSCGVDFAQGYHLGRPAPLGPPRLRG